MTCADLLDTQVKFRQVQVQKMKYEIVIWLYHISFLNISCIGYEYLACMDYMDLDGCCPQKAFKLNHSHPLLDIMTNVHQ